MGLECLLCGPQILSSNECSPFLSFGFKLTVFAAGASAAFVGMAIVSKGVDATVPASQVSFVVPDVSETY